MYREKHFHTSINKRDTLVHSINNNDYFVFDIIIAPSKVEEFTNHVHENFYGIIQTIEKLNSRKCTATVLVPCSHAKSFSENYLNYLYKA